MSYALWSSCMNSDLKLPQYLHKNAQKDLTAVSRRREVKRIPESCQAFIWNIVWDLIPHTYITHSI